MSANPDSVVGQGEFHSSIKPSEPMEKHGHSQGTKVGNDAYPTFQAQTLPPNTAPASRTFAPNPTSSIPGQSYPESKRETWQDAASTLTGSTSADVHAGMGKPVFGQTAGDVRHGERSGLEGVGASSRDPIRERGLDREQAKGGKTRDDVTVEERAGMVGVEGREPVGAEEVAAERK